MSEYDIITILQVGMERTMYMELSPGTREAQNTYQKI